MTLLKSCLVWLIPGLLIAGRCTDAAETGGQIVPGHIFALEHNVWVIAADPENVGKAHEWWKAPVKNAVPATLPGILQQDLPGYHGVVWYWCDFDAPANPLPGGRALLRFGAVDYLAEVWMNGASVGGHEGGETPFTLDVTAALKPRAKNRLAVRVLNPSGEPIDGIVLGETPHRNKGVKFTVGGSYNGGGITEPVELLYVPVVRIADAFVRADWQSGVVQIEATVHNAGPAVNGQIQWDIAPALSGPVAVTKTTRHDFPAGDSVIHATLQVPHHRLWELEDPFLYRLTARLSADRVADEFLTRFGFRDFRVKNGFFHFNGRRIFLRSSHTGNHCPAGQILAPKEAPDLLRRDLLYAKANGFNTVRFIAGIAHPWQLNVCDEIGLMVYQESYAGWLLGDSPKMTERFDFSIREMILRDRNHPSVTIWGLLNETQDGAVFRHAVDSLALVRSLDDTRLTLLDSGRWDLQFNIGSISNPGSNVWECVWGTERPDYPMETPPRAWTIGGYMEGAGDAHVYPGVPHTPEIEKTIRTLGQGVKPVFLSEYGIGSLMNAVRELRTYKQFGIRQDLDDVQYFQRTVDRLSADWDTFGMNSVYAFPEDMLIDSQRLHIRQRLLGFNLIRSNPQICGYNLTGLLDHGFTGEGLWTYWREWKPGIADALRDGWAPLRWCLFVAPMHGYVNRPFKVEAVLANESVLAPGSYPVTFRIAGPLGVVWEQTATATIPQPAPDEDGPLAVPVFAGEVTLDGPPGQYILAADMPGAAPLGCRLNFYLSESPPDAALTTPVALWGIDAHIAEWLQARGVTCESWTPGQAQPIILVGNPAEDQPDDSHWTALWEEVSRGAAAVFLTPQAFKKGDDALARFPLASKGRIYDFPDWLYHKECVAKPHPIFAGLQPKGVMDWDYYGPVISHLFFEGADLPEETVAAAFALCHSAPPGGYASGVMIGVYPHGKGRFVLNTFNVLGNIDTHPAADRLLLNLLRYAGEHVVAARS